MTATIIKLTERRPQIEQPTLGRDQAYLARLFAGFEPIPQTVQQIRESRDNRGARWHALRAKLDYVQALIELGREAAHAVRCGMKGAIVEQHAALYDDWPDLIKMYRAVLVELMMTPTPTRSALMWKQAQRNSSSFNYVPGVNADAVDALIAADDVYLRETAPGARKRRSLR